MPTIRLILGDSFKVVAALEGVGVVITDPPYGLEFLGAKWDKLDMANYASISAGNGNPHARRHSVSFLGSPNPTCRKCGGLRSLQTEGGGGRRKCQCDVPNFPDYRTPAMQAMQEWHRGWLGACFGILPPGGIIKAFSATRTFHRMAAAMEDVGFLLDPAHSLLGWTYGSGFPKYLNTSKAIDAHAGKDHYFDLVRSHLQAWKVERGLTNPQINAALGLSTSGCGMARHWTSDKGTQHSIPSKDQWARLKEALDWPDCPLDHVYAFIKDGAERPGTGDFKKVPVVPHFPAEQSKTTKSHQVEITEAATPEAARFDGWATALKPGWEPFVVGRKP